jgi:hypothetical protein
MAGLNNAYGLIAGIANYPHIKPLPEIVLKDARDIYDSLLDPNLCGYQKENVTVLLDGEATKDAFRESLKQLANRADEKSTVFFYLSSHGGRIDAGPHAGEYILPFDVKYTSEQSLAETSISGAEFSEALRKIRAHKLVVVFDCCHSGGVGQPKSAVAIDLKSGLSESYYDRLKTGAGRVIMASSRSSEYSYVMPDASNSLFTQHFLAALRGGSPGPGGVIRIFDIFDYLQPRVTAAHSEQHPIFKAELEENFPIALYLGGKAAAPAPEPPQADGFDYDVFISYPHENPSETWVKKKLAPRLKAEGLRVCVDYECFQLGRSLIKEMERAVENSRYTLSVITPAYLTSGFTEFEEILSQHVGLERRQSRYMGIMREPCKPGLRVRARFWLDMTDDNEFEENFARLAYQLRLPPS